MLSFWALGMIGVGVATLVVGDDVLSSVRPSEAGGFGWAGEGALYILTGGLIAWATRWARPKRKL
jgi:hypothetical protein